MILKQAKKNTIEKVIIIISLLLIIGAGFKRLHQPAKDFEEWEYLNVFLSANSGQALYREIFFSQPPGFFLMINPGLYFFGNNLPAGRLSVYLWSLIGLGGLFWLSYEIKKPWAGIMAIGILYLIPHYFKEIMTFRADSLIPVFSALAMASMFHFSNSGKEKYLILSIIFFTISFLVKLDFSTTVPLFLIYLKAYKNKLFKLDLKKIIRHTAFFLIIVLIFLNFLLWFFDIRAVFNNVFILGIHALRHYPFIKFSDALLIRKVINTSPILSLLIISFFIGFHGMFEKKKDQHLLILFFWLLFSLAILVFYKPFFSHQLVFSTYPASLIFSYFFVKIAKKIKHRNLIISLFLFITACLYALYVLIIVPKGLLTKDQQDTLKIVLEHTKKEDYIVSDDYSFLALSGRKTVPELADVSQVRIISGHLTPGIFQQNILVYKPKLIIAWTGRLKLIRDFQKIIKNYTLLKQIDNEHQIYIKN